MAEKHGNWTDLFSITILGRGKAYFRNGRVKDFTESSGDFTMTVRGKRNYTVFIGRNAGGDVTKLQCTCPYARMTECKHMAAGLFYLEEYLGRMVNFSSEDSDEEREMAGGMSGPAAAEKASVSRNTGLERGEEGNTESESAEAKKKSDLNKSTGVSGQKDPAAEMLPAL